jgi:hypothetical protein
MPQFVSLCGKGSFREKFTLLHQYLGTGLLFNRLTVVVFILSVLEAFEKLQRRVLASSCLSVRLSLSGHGRARLPPDGFSSKSVVGNFMNICRES